ncbi:hypothetical protein AB664_30185 [Brucella anthropi]|uniref:Uncharacterized protein n=1 Tax=Brucella anthropi TaxID=529 RepID=A0A656Z625_BRUAN|nr:hypothetical protein AB664_30185 [Brucella anthropi]
MIISEEVPAPEHSTGVIVEINDLRRDFRAFENEHGLQDLNEIFALYLMNYRSVSNALWMSTLLTLFIGTGLTTYVPIPVVRIRCLDWQSKVPSQIFALLSVGRIVRRIKSFDIKRLEML